MSLNSINDLAQTIWDHHKANDPSKRTLVNISGIPGSGKPTLARLLAESLNRIFIQHSHSLQQQGASSDAEHSSLSPNTPFAIDIPMDGYHLSRAQLAGLPDPETAIHRRGAAFTYDATGYFQLVQQLAQPINHDSPEIFAPAFDHATKDPVENSIEITAKTKIVILEGNYVNLDREPWKEAAELFYGICVDEESARWRVESTDDLNAEDILGHQVEGVVGVVLQDCT
ncbi:hypothetical protein DL98DRAFT_639799 [Cadophora sp. DSE1049]|nr:hypothetical protein DL98DRAFT_639799 [Cadophora sp. DSE1049]